MQVHLINNNYSNPNFGAKIRLKNPKIETLLDYSDKEWASKVLDDFNKFRQDENIDIEIDWKREEFDNRLCNYLYAKNSKTNNVKKWIMFPENFEKCNNLQNCDAFYAFIKDLMDPDTYDFRKFWGPEKNINYNNIDLKKHNVFIV